MTDERFIKSAIKHPGSLRAYAKKHRLLDEDGNINLQKANAFAERKKDLHRIRQINLAKTLRNVNSKRMRA